MRDYYVYTFWDLSCGPLYVGCTGNLPQRMRAHESMPWSRQADFITYRAFADKDEAFSVETHNILYLMPRYNRARNPRWYDYSADPVTDPTVRERKIAALDALRNQTMARWDVAS